MHVCLLIKKLQHSGIPRGLTGLRIWHCQLLGFGSLSAVWVPFLAWELLLASGLAKKRKKKKKITMFRLLEQWDCKWLYYEVRSWSLPDLELILCLSSY